MKLKSICKFLLGSAVVIVVIVLALVISFIVYCYNAKDNVVSDSIEVRQEVNDSIMLQVDSEQELDSTNIQEPQVESEQEKLARKFLITNNSAGLFTLNDTIGNLAKWYGWDTSASIFYFDGCIRPSLNLSGGIDLFHKYCRLHRS